MATNKIFLDLEGLALYDQLIKEYVDSKSTSGSAELLKAINELANGAVKNNTAAIATLNGNEETEGSVKKIVKDAIDNLVDGAPQTYDTLKEIADWIANDETGSAALVTRVGEAETAIEKNTQSIINLKSYVDTQDNYYYNSIGSINDSSISNLFKTAKTMAEGQSISEALAALGEDEKLVLSATNIISEDVTVPEGTTIDANGATFTGNVSIPENAVVQNAIFTGKVTIG